jgi:predicted TIM-barrel fold metal-dependent hydrolase
MVIDFHAHAFPGKLAQRALETLSAEAGGLEPVYDGTPEGLRAYIGANGVGAAVVLSIATNGRQQRAVNDFVIAINAEEAAGAPLALAAPAGAFAQPAPARPEPAGAPAQFVPVAAPAAAPLEPESATAFAQPAPVAGQPKAALAAMRLKSPAAAELAQPAPAVATIQSAQAQLAPALAASQPKAALAAGRLVAFGSVFPYAPDAMYELDRLRDAGVKGIKFHPEYQQFFVDDERVIPLYRRIARLGFITVFHAGADIGFAKPVHSTPSQFAKILPLFGGYPVVAAHMGGYLQWDEVERHLAGTGIYLDTSYMYSRIPAPQAAAIAARHGARRILFGSDLPWSAPGGEMRLVKSLGLSPEDEMLVMGGNAERLPGSDMRLAKSLGLSPEDEMLVVGGNAERLPGWAQAPPAGRRRAARGARRVRET